MHHCLSKLTWFLLLASVPAVGYVAIESAFGLKVFILKLFRSSFSSSKKDEIVIFGTPISFCPNKNSFSLAVKEYFLFRLSLEFFGSSFKGIKILVLSLATCGKTYGPSLWVSASGAALKDKTDMVFRKGFLLLFCLC